MNAASKMAVVLCLFTPSVFSASALAAADCDCTVVTGRCSGAVEFLKSYGSNKNYGAEINVHSSERMCSKVEYYVDNTPYTTVLNNKNSQTESLFGTSPIKKDNVKFNACYVCKKNAPAAGSSSAAAADPVDKFLGAWHGVRKSNLGFSKQMTVEVQKSSGNRVTLSIAEDSDRYSATGTVSHEILSFAISGGCDGTIKLTSANSASYQCALGIFTSSASLRR